MSEKDAKTWKKLSALFPPTDAQRQQACELCQQLLKYGTWDLAQDEILALELPVVFDFYYRLALFTTPGRVYSRKQSTQWFATMHVFRVDLRTVSGWLGLLKLAPMFSHQAVVLEPFCQCAQGQSALVTSHVNLDDALYATELQEQGLSFVDFIPLVFEGLRRLKIAVGFTVYPFVFAQAIACTKKPELFQNTSVGSKKFFNMSHPDTCVYIANVCRHYAKTYGFDFVYYCFESAPETLTSDFWQRLETQSRIAPSFAILGGVSLPFYSDSPYLMPLSIDNLPLCKISLCCVQASLLPLVSFLALYTSIFPCVLNSDEHRYFAAIRMGVEGLIKFDRKHVREDYQDYTVWIWVNKHEVGILLAVWQAQERVEVDLTDWLKGDSFYQQVTWGFHDYVLTSISDELLSSDRLIFTKLATGDARIVSIKT